MVAVALCLACWIGYHLVQVLPSWDNRSGQVVCTQSSAPHQTWSFRVFKLALPALAHVTFEGLANRYGSMYLYTQQSSLTREDTTDAIDGGLDEKQQLFSDFLDDIANRRAVKYNYVKILDRPSRQALELIGIERLLPLGEAIEHEMRRALTLADIAPPELSSWSLWIGGANSTTSLHVDDVGFNVLVVLHGAKRLVLVDPERHTFSCHRPALNPNACWVGLDVLSGPLPSFAHEVILRAGEAVLLPEMYWHSVENLEPTIAVGLNERTDCAGARFLQLRSEFTDRRYELRPR